LVNKFPSNRDIRYQGAIIENDRILLIKHMPLQGGSPYWLIPGGGREDGETEAECVQREMKEETNLDVEVADLLLDEPGFPGGPYPWRKTYLCKPIGGEAKPGYEPELEAASAYAIFEVKWFDLKDISGWDQLLTEDPNTRPQVERIREKLGYMASHGRGAVGDVGQTLS
jgi:8-oxo-dGTP pyrophosphatase MutT (NUDIX family)